MQWPESKKARKFKREHLERSWGANITLWELYKLYPSFDPIDKLCVCGELYCSYSLSRRSTHNNRGIPKCIRT